MGILNVFSKRQRKLRGEGPEVYVYDELPNQLRVQIVHILRDAIGIDGYGQSAAEDSYRSIHNELCREYGLFTLKDNASSNSEAVFGFFLETEDTERALDVVELCFSRINQCIRAHEYRYDTHVAIEPDEAIDELNGRLREHGIGYHFESNMIARIDSQFIHSEAVKPALRVLQDTMYQGANDEFLKAHEHYRHQRNKECLNECLKSFESLLKSICDKHKWKYSANDTSKRLLDICLGNELIPQYMQSQFSSLRSLLESGVPTIRNKLGGHGQGPGAVTVGQDIASYCLHLTATTIVFLAGQEERLP